MWESILIEYPQTWDNFQCFEEVLAYSVHLISARSNCCVGTELLNFSFSNFSSEGYQVSALIHLYEGPRRNRLIYRFVDFNLLCCLYRLSHYILHFFGPVSGKVLIQRVYLKDNKPNPELSGFGGKLLSLREFKWMPVSNLNSSKLRGSSLLYLIMHIFAGWRSCMLS